MSLVEELVSAVDRSTRAKPAAEKGGMDVSAQAVQADLKRLEQVKETLIRLSAEREATAKRLEEASAEFKEAFGTSDIDELREMYTRGRDENIKKSEAFHRQVDEIETSVKMIMDELAKLDAKAGK